MPRLRKALKILLVLALVLGTASLVSLYAYGRFVEQARGAPGHALPVQPAATAMDRAIAPLLRAHPGQSGLALYMRNTDAFALRAQAARSAGRSLDLQYYLWHDDLTGQLLAGEVMAAADRGVRVRVILDDINAHGADAGLRTVDLHPNIEVRMFNPARNRGSGLSRAVELLTRGLSLNRRMHNKAWIADGRVAVVGGRNIGDEYFDASAEANFLDADVAVVGPAVEETSAIFDTFWNSDMVIPIASLAKKPPRLTLPGLRTQLRTLADGEQARPYLQHADTAQSLREVLTGAVALHWSEEVNVRSDPPDKSVGGPGEGWLIDTVAGAFESARTRIELISPYFVPGDEGVRWLGRLRERGVGISILTNSLAATDVFAVHGAYADYREPLLEQGVELYELMPHGARGGSLFGSSGASLHTKAFTIDDRLGFVGSLNFDPRSVTLNTEMGVLARDPAFVAQLRAAYAQRTASNSYRVALADGDLRWEDARRKPVRVWTREPEAGFWRRVGARVVGWLPIESQL